MGDQKVRETKSSKSVSKRKPQEDLVTDESNDKPKPKTKKTKGPTVPLHSDLPNNRNFPTKLEFRPKPESSVRISAWNVCGVNACDKKGLKVYLEAEDPDLMIMSETKMQVEPNMIHLKQRFKYRYWGADPKKGYAGVAILSKHKPLEVIYGLPTLDDQVATQGRMITLEFSSFYLIGTYTPNAGENLQFMERKKEWNVGFENFLRQLDLKKPVIWGGDINCALTEKDLRNATTSWNKIAGYTKDECDALEKQLNPEEGSGHQKLVDAWRRLNPDLEGHYTYFSYRFGCREKGIGWRIDSFIVSERVFEKVKTCEIRQECYGASDHVPIVLEIELNL